MVSLLEHYVVDDFIFLNGYRDSSSTTSKVVLEVQWDMFIEMLNFLTFFDQMSNFY